MRRIWFKKEMRDAILEGKKTATTRDHQKALGVWEAVTGSFYSPQPFAIINITENNPSTWTRSLEHFKEEGFETLEDMLGFAFGAGLNKYANAKALYYHRFSVKRKTGDR